MSEIKISARDKILKSAVDEFGEHGYKHASTNNIVTRAEVSKGLIFHYFGSKENLHMVCFENGLRLFNERMEERKAFEPKDYFERLFKYTVCKLEFAYENPNMSKMFMDAYSLARQGRMPHLTKLFEEVEKAQWRKLISGVDTSGFRDDIHTDKILDYIQSSLNVFTQKYVIKGDFLNGILPELETLTAELQEVVEFIKHGVYSSAKNQSSGTGSLNPQASL